MSKITSLVKLSFILIMFLLMVSCTGRKSSDVILSDDEQSVEVLDSMRPDTLHHPSPDEFDDDHMPPPPPDGKDSDGPPPPDGKHSDGPPPPDGKHSDGPPPPNGDHFDGPPPPPHHGEGDHEPDNMRGFDPASEDDMKDNGMQRYFDANDEEAWD